MKRVILLVLILIMVSTTAGAAYKIQLKSGQVITADDKPILKDDMAYFTKVGLYLYLPVSQIDLVKTDEINMVTPSASSISVEPSTLLPPPTTAVAPVFIDEDQLQIIRKRSRLANEGGLTTFVPPAPGAAAPGSGESQPPQSGGGERQQMAGQLADLMAQRQALDLKLRDLRAQRDDTLNNFNFSVQQNDKEAYQRQLDSLDAQIADVQRQADGLLNQLNDLQIQMQRSQANGGV